MFVLSRAVGFVARAPGFSRLGVPMSARAGTAFFLASIVPAHYASKSVDGVMLVALCAGEALVGALLAVSATVVYEAAAAAGRLIDDQMGIRAALPGADVGSAGLAKLWSLAFVVAFFALDGYGSFVFAFARSFEAFPLGAAFEGAAIERTARTIATALPELALSFAAPSIAVATIVHLSLAAVGRILPRFGNLTLAFPAAFGCVLVLGFATLGVALRMR